MDKCIYCGDKIFGYEEHVCSSCSDGIENEQIIWFEEFAKNEQKEDLKL